MKDATGRVLAYVYARENRADADTAKVLTMEEARRVASNIAKLQTLLGAAVRSASGTLSWAVRTGSNSCWQRLQFLNKVRSGARGCSASLVFAPAPFDRATAPPARVHPPGRHAYRLENSGAPT